MKKIILTLIFATQIFAQEKVSLLNVSYDPTREFYEEFNKAFSEHYLKEKNLSVEIKQSHGGSGKQARSVIDGLEADVVTLALAYDIDELAVNGLVSSDWQTKLPNKSTPYTSTIVFLVRKGNPKKIKDWDDLIKPDIGVITPNPKTSGGARWNYLAAYGYALYHNDNQHDKAKEFVKKLFKNVPVLDTGARGSTTTFVQRQLGDVLITWENEAHLAIHELGKGQLELVIPSISILAEPPVAVVTKVAKKKGSEVIASDYLNYLYSEIGQTLAAKHYFRPRLERVLITNRDKFPNITMFSIEDYFGSWQKAHQDHFTEGALFDKIYSS